MTRFRLNDPVSLAEFIAWLASRHTDDDVVVEITSMRYPEKKLRISVEVEYP